MQLHHRHFSQRARIRAALVAATLVAPIAVALAPVGAASTTTSTVLANADTYVDSNHPAKAYGSATDLYVDGAPQMRTFVRFEVPSAAGTITRATLRLRLTDARRSPQIAIAAAGWDERLVSWSAAPAIGATIGATRASSGTAWVDVDVTSAVTTAGPVAFAVLPTSSRSQKVSSRESGAAPQLVVQRTVADTTTTTTAPTPTTAPPTSGGAATYFVDATAGNDANDGRTPSTAWRTAAKVATAALAPGESVAFRRNQTFGRLVLGRSGTATSKITVTAWGEGAAPRFTGGSSCVRVDGSHLVLQHLHADDCSWAGFDLAGDAVTVQRSLATRNATGVFVRAGADGNRILHSQIRDNAKMSVLTSGGDDDSGAFGVLVQGDGTEIAHNTIAGHDAFSYDYGRDGAAVEIYGARSTNIHHNVASQNHTFTELGNSRSADTTYAYNEVRSTLPGSTFLVTRGAGSSWGPVYRTVLHNNTVAITGDGGQGFICHAGCAPELLQMRNNIIQATWKVGYADGPIDAANDIYWGGQRQFTMGPGSRVVDPGFVDLAAGNVKLRAGSAAVDTGVPIGYVHDLSGHAVPLDGDGDGRSAVDVGSHERLR